MSSVNTKVRKIEMRELAQVASKHSYFKFLLRWVFYLKLSKYNGQTFGNFELDLDFTQYGYI